jgi:hypothetical protein
MIRDDHRKPLARYSAIKACLLAACSAELHHHSGPDLLRAAATEGKLAVYIFADVQPSVTNLEPNPVFLPRDVLTRMIPARGTLPDHTIRPSIKIAGGNAKILKLLELGILLVGAEEFDIWYRSEQVKGKWPSQRSGLKKRKGRPSKQTDALRNAVITA